MSQPLPYEEPTTPLPGLPVLPGPAPGDAAEPRRGRLRWLIVGGAAVAVAVVLGVSVALLGSPASHTSAAPPPPAASASQNQKHSGVRGTIVTENGSTWTVRTPAGKTVTVVIGAQTRFGTAKAPKTGADFPVGTAVAVAGAVEHDSVTATRISAVRRAPASPAPSTTA